MNSISTVVETFPNGNLEIKPEIQNFINRYQSSLRKTAESILGLSETLVQAERKLNAVDFLIFCQKVGLEKGSPTYSKLKKIGEKSERFRPFVDRLPNTWTTIYKLSKLEPDQFSRVSASLTPFITSTEIDEQIGINPNVKTVYDFKISAESLDGESKAKFYDSLLSLKEQFNFTLTEGSKILKELKTVKLAKAA